MGVGLPPKDPSQRINNHPPARGEIQTATAVGWQHGPVPPCPLAMPTEEARQTWATWMGSWFAFFWTPEDLPGLAIVIKLYDQVVGMGITTKATELRLWSDTYGITPKGQQDRRWRAPASTGVAPTSDGVGSETPRRGRRYGHLDVAG